MARDIKKLEWMTYVPKWEGNDKEENPISLEIHPLGFIELTKYASMINGSSGSEIELGKKMVIENVRNVKNLKCNGKDITHGQEIWDLGILALINEVAQAILDLSKLQDNEKKT